MITIFRKEINIFFSSLIAYIVISVFLIATGLFVWILPDVNVFDFGYASLQELFEIAPWVFMFLIPAITMRSFAEEHSIGTMEILVTKPVSDLEIVLGKYLAGLVLVLFSLIPTLIYFYTIYYFAEPTGNVDIGGTWGSYLGLLLLGSTYVSFGIFASAISNNQIISFILAVFICFIFYALIGWLRGFSTSSGFDPVLEFLSMKVHFDSLSRGVIDTRDAVYFLSLSALFIFITETILGSRKWS